MAIIYILAAIGAICLLGIIGLVIIFVATPVNGEERTGICALTDEPCIYTIDKGTCEGCPIAEEAEKVGDR